MLLHHCECVGLDAAQWRIQGGFLVARKPPPPAKNFF